MLSIDNVVTGVSSCFLAAIPLLVFPTTSFAGPITFTYDCTIDGSSQGGQGTNSCAGGPTIAQVRISETAAINPDPGGSAVLLIEARLQFNSPTNPPDNTYELDALWLNIDETLLGSLLGNSGLPWFDGPGSNDYNTLLFDFDGDFSSGAQTIKVEANSTDGGSWKNFDLGLCKSDTGQAPGSCQLDLPIVDLAYYTLDTQPWSTLGFLNSGNSYNLKPEDFDFLTTNISDPGMVNYSPCSWSTGELASAIKLEPATSPTLQSTCLSGASYGPRYGVARAADTPPDKPVPTPGTLALMSLGVAGLGWLRRKIV